VILSKSLTCGAIEMFVDQHCLFLGPAPEKVTDAIYEITRKIAEYPICPEIECNLETIAIHKFQASILQLSLWRPLSLSLSHCTKH